MNLNRDNRPSLEQIERELARRNRISRRFKALRITMTIFLVVIAIAVLAATYFIPVLRVSGTSMEPELNQGDVVVVLKSDHMEQGDIVAFYYNNKILLKRIIAGEGDSVDIDSLGNVYVNGTLLKEDYAKYKGEGKCDITFPYQVPEDSWFVLGDNRSTSTDSRTEAIGCVKKEDILGKVFVRIYPLNKVGIMSEWIMTAR